MGFKTYKATVAALDQATGSYEFDLTGYERYEKHQLLFVPSATPVLAGTGTVSIQNPGSSTYFDLPTTVDLTAAAEYLVSIPYFADKIKFSTALFDAAKTYSLFLFSAGIQ